MKNKNVLILTLSTVIILSALATFANSYSLNPKKKTDDFLVNSSNNSEDTLEIKEIPLTDEEIKENEIKIVQDAVLSNIGNYTNNVAVYYENLKTGTTYKLNEDKYFTGASVRKLGNIMGAADLILEDKLDKNKLLSYNPNTDYEGGTGILQTQGKISPITVDRAMELAIVYSDNIATRILSKYASWAQPYIEKITGTPAKNGTLTANQVGILLKRLYENPNNNPTYNDIIEDLKNTIFHDRLDKYLPYDKVAHKIGTNYSYYHDAGIIYGPNNDYILIVLTENIGSAPMVDGTKTEAIFSDNNDAACETIALISKDIFNNLKDMKLTK